MSSTPHRRTAIARLLSWTCFVLLASALAFAVLDAGGQNPLGWNISLLIVGAGAITYLLTVSSANRLLRADTLTRWPLLLPSAYVALQLVPLPVTLVRLLSPARAGLVDSLASIMPVPAFTPISIDPATTAAYLLRTIGYTLTALLVYEICSLLWRHRSWVPVVVLVCVAGFEACLGIVQFANQAEVSGTYHSKDHFAGALEMALPLAVAYGISLLKRAEEGDSLPVSRAVKACTAFALAGAMLVGLVYSLSKMGFAAGLWGLFAMGILVILAKLDGIRRWLALAGVAVCGLLVFVLLPTNQLAGAYAEYFQNDPASVEGRAPIWNDSRHLLGDYPFVGTGLGTYGTSFLKYQTADVDRAYVFAHNDYLELGSELGVVGFLIFGCLLLKAFLRAMRAAFRGDWNTRMLGMGCVGALVAIGVHSLADFNLYIPANALFLSWVIGITLSLPVDSDRPASTVVKPRTITLPEHFRAIGNFALRTVPILLGGLLLSSASAGVVLETKYKGDRQTQNRFCRLGICGTGYASEAQPPESSTPTASLAGLVRATKRDPANPDRWCDLGDAFLRVQHREQARYCFSTALALAPEVPPVLFRSAKFYHAVEDDELALKQAARVVELSDNYRSSVLDWYRDQKFRVMDILCHGLPRIPRAAQAYLSYLIDLGDLANAKTTWDWILSHRYADLPITRDYVGFLFRKSEYPEAATAWTGFLGDRRNGYREANWLFNGDFELEPAAVPFDWTLGNIDGQVETTLDPTVAHTGTRSLRIRFAGTENVSYGETLQKSVVPTGTYRLTAFVRTENVTTDRGIAIRIVDAENSGRLDVRTEQFLGTHPWTKEEKIVRIPAATKLLAVQVLREPTLKFDNKISGTAWIDTVSLSRVQ